MHDTRYATSGMVCSVDHLASAAGVAALDRGGSAADAAIATNAVLAVTAPHMCGLGGDLFALVHDGSPGEVTALNASGRAGSGADPDRLRAEGHERMPHLHDIRSVPVPGCVDGWLALHERYGRLPLPSLLEPAIRLASQGFAASPLMLAGARVAAGRPGGGDFAAVRAAGDRMTRPGVARALSAVAADGRAGFYLGEFGEGLLELGGGEYDRADLARPNADWVTPLAVRAFGHDVWSMPPNSQGYLLLMALGIADGLDLPASPGDPLWAHLLAEAARVSGHDRLALLHEDAKDLLSSGEIERRRALVDPARRLRLTAPAEPGDTTYLCAVDGDGMGVSLIQSNAAGFGSMLFEPRTGINLHNRGIGFSLTPGHPAEYGPGRRPPHTLAPALVTRPDGALRSVVGTMGGDAQPQILLQVITRLLRHGELPGEAVAAPRWRIGAAGTGFDTWYAPDDTVLDLEDGTPWSDGLAALGHPVTARPYGSTFGHAHLIDVRPDGVLAGAADPRALIGAAIGR
ncbi:gamma-glutamyltransferase [Nonomuraea sp. 3-1Str]|uniref:gamma-glutamyltransferase family protein n=1 Tax=Nonomuraea sp. 3-1Str TaxID=2929801 RepID=UPI002855D0AE|nr:gamma-glutamyltransferase [Nonomuraea sp. 3-1Str]MDR8410877.1 gamma-glutamyltransferase [Nonomuraea sp. 3-1Str]